MAKDKRGYLNMFSSGDAQVEVQPQIETVNPAEQPIPVTTSGKKRGRPVGSKGKKQPKEAVSLKLDNALLYHLRWVSDKTGIPFSRMMEDAARHLLLSSDWAFLLEDHHIDIIAEREKKLKDEKKAIEGRYHKSEME